MIVTTNLQLAVLWAIAQSALAINLYDVSGSNCQIQSLTLSQIFRSSNNSGFSGIWKHALPDFTWHYTTCRSELKTTVHPSGNVTGRTVASELVWMPSCSFPLSPSLLSALATPSSGNCFDCTVCFGLDILMSFFSNVSCLWCSSQFQCA